MKKINLISSAFLMCLFVMLLADYSFASNLTDKHVYRLFCENFNGATQEAKTSVDNIKFNVWSGGGDSVPTATIVADSTTAKEGSNYYSCVASNIGYWCWFYLTDKLDTTAGSYAVVWNSNGFHSAENAGEFYGMSGEIYPRIYLGAKFTNALGSLTYKANITIELAHE